MKGIQQHILYADDNQDDTLLIQMAFKKSGQLCTLNSVPDGAAAMEYLKGEGAHADRQAHPFPTLVLLDIKMPRYTGLEVLEWVRSQPAFSALPVVMFTSSKNLEDVRRAYELGANAYLVKPVDYHEIQASLRALAAFWFEHNILPL
jgi:CheY-like chemotaxis protein